MTVYRRPDPIPLRRERPAGAFTLQRIKPEQEDLHHLVARQIFAAITSGSYAEGTVLPKEETLSQHLGVSRTALREAIKGLASKGMLETRRRRGTLVLDRNNWNMLDAEVLAWLRRDDGRGVSEQLWQTVVALLPSLGALAARRGMTPDLRSAPLAKGETGVGARVDFILAIARSAGNRFALSVVAGALKDLSTADSVFMDNATRGLTAAAANAISSAIGAFDSAAAQTHLQSALSPSEAVVSA